MNLAIKVAYKSYFVNSEKVYKVKILDRDTLSRS